jgi:hypothetical protein
MADNAEPHQVEPLRVEAKYDGPEVTITVEGELDVTTAGDLLASVRDALERLTQDRSVTIDPHGLSCAVSGLRGTQRQGVGNDLGYRGHRRTRGLRVRTTARIGMTPHSAN